MMLAKWKEIVVALALLVICNFVVGLLCWRAGASHQAESDKVVYDQREVEYGKQKNAAVAKSQDAQRQADLDEINTARQQAADSRKAVDDSRKSENTTLLKNATLTNEIARLRHADKDVDAWYNACLPAALRSSVHAECAAAGNAGSR